jgi:transcriptional regulator with XRE-family HTH domain
MPRTNREPGPPTLRSQWLGQKLRELRLQHGLTLAEAAAYLGIDRSGLARFERAEWPFKRDHVLALLDRYQVRDPDERSRLLRQQEEAWRVDIFDTELTGSIYDETTVSLGWLESRAELICTYTNVIMPGLLQTSRYAEEVMKFYGNPTKVVDRSVKQRLARQQVVTGAKATKLSAIIDEPALRRPIGDAAVMRDQLAKLITLGRRPNVEVRVLPPSAPRPDGAWGQFAVLRLPEPYTSVGYLENVGGRFYFESPTSKRFIEAYDRLRKAALPPDESAELIKATAKEWA